MFICSQSDSDHLSFAAHSLTRDKIIARHSALMLASIALVAGAALFAPTPSKAACVTSGKTTTCDDNGPNPWNKTVGTGSGDNDRTVIVETDAIISTKEINAIAVGENSSITIESGATVTNTSETRRYGVNRMGNNTIDLDSNSRLTVEENAKLTLFGSSPVAETIDFFGTGSTVINNGLIHAESRPALWSESQSGPANKIINNETGTISTGTGGTIIGANGPIDFTNKGLVKGDISFGSADDVLRLYSTSLITGTVAGGGGDDKVFLEGDKNGASDSNFGGFENLTKNDSGTWTLSGKLESILKAWVNGGTLKLTGDNSRPTGEIAVKEQATLEAGAKSLLSKVRNNGTLRLTQTDDGAYSGTISGTGGVIKEGAGTATLTNVNTYTGATHIEAGGLKLAGDGSIADSNLVLVDATFDISMVNGAGSTLRRLTGDKTGKVVLGDKELSISDARNDTFHGVISGAGGLYIKKGRQTLTGTNTYTGGTGIGSDAALELTQGGSIKGNVVNNGALAFNRSSEQTFAGDISGTGKVRHIGSGKTILSGRNSYAGETSVEAGTLAAGAAQSLSASSAHRIARGAALDLADHDQAVKSLTNGSLVDFGRAAGTTLTTRNNYVGKEGTMRLSSVLGGDDSRTDRLHVMGDMSGTSDIAIENLGGKGGLTEEGIKIIDVDGSSDAMFRLLGNYQHGDHQAIGMGAYSYGLFKNGISTPDDGDWYLRSAYQPGAALYEALPRQLQAMNGLPTLRQRTGNRYWSRAGNIVMAQGDGPGIAEAPPSPDLSDPSATLVESQALWGRIEGLSGTFHPETSTSHAEYEQSYWKAQAGLDGQLYETLGGVLIGSVTGHYAEGRMDVSSPSGGGEIDTTGIGFGGALTWHGRQGFYLDGQAQATWYDSDLTSSLLDRDMASGVKGFGYAVGVETGQRFDLDSHWSLTPQAQLTYSSIDFDDFVDIAPFRANVSLREGDSLIGRAGVQIDYQNSWQASNGTTSRVNFYGAGNVYYEFLDGTQVSVGSARTVNFASASDASASDRTWAGVSAGGSYNWSGDRYSIYGETFARTSLADFGDSYSLGGTAGLRIKW